MKFFKFINFLFFLVIDYIIANDPNIFLELNNYIEAKLERVNKSNSLKNLMTVEGVVIRKSKKYLNATREYINCMKTVSKNCRQILNVFQIDNEKLFNIFQLDKYSKRNSLIIASLLAIDELNVKPLINNMDEFINYLNSIQAMYRKIPYQNRNHPAELLIKLVFWIRKIKSSGKVKNGTIYESFIVDSNDISKRVERLEFILTITGHDSFYQGLSESQVCNPQTNYKTNSLSGGSNNLTKIVCKAITACNNTLFAANEKVSSFVAHRVLSKYKFYTGQYSEEKYTNTLKNIFYNCGKDTSNDNGFNIDYKNLIHSLIISTTDSIEDKAQDKFIDNPNEYTKNKFGIYQLFMNALDNSYTVTKNPALSMKLSMQILCQDISSYLYKKYYESNNKVIVANDNIFDFILESQSNTVLRLKKFYQKFDEITNYTLNLTFNIKNNYVSMIDTLNFELFKSKSNHYNYFRLCIVSNYLPKEKEFKDIRDLNNNFVEFVSCRNSKINNWKKRINRLNYRKDDENYLDENSELIKGEYYQIENEIENKNEEDHTKHFLK